MTVYLKDALKNSANVEGIAASGANDTKPFHTTDSVYEDKAYPLIGRRLSSNLGTADYDWDELAVEFAANGDMSDVNDLVGLNAELPHQAKADGKIYPHFHWWQTSANDVVFELDYRIQDNSEAKTTAWTRMYARANGDSTFTYSTGTLNQITRFNSANDGTGDYFIDMTGVGISATLQFKMTRTDATAGTVSVMFFDFHYEIDDLGSRDEFVK